MARIVREFNGYELWLDGEDYAAICRADEKPDFEEYSVPYLTKEWNRITGDSLEDDFFRGGGTNNNIR